MIKAIAVLYEAFWEFRQDDGPALAGYIAFSGLLGFFPFIILTTNIAALTLGEGQSQQAVDALFAYAPPHVAQTLEPVLLDVLRGAGSGLLTLSALAAVWFSSNAFEAIRMSFDRAYNVPEPRGWFTGRLISIACVFGGTIASILLGFLIVLGPLAIQLIEGWFGITIPFFAGLSGVHADICDHLWRTRGCRYHIGVPLHNRNGDYLWGRGQCGIGQRSDDGVIHGRFAQKTADTIDRDRGRFSHLGGEIFRASEVLAKHDENYMPKEVADALKEQGLFKGEEGS